jgi:hypothetical protein
VLSRSAYFLIALLGLAFVLLTLPGARQFGASLLASAGVAGIVAGIAAKPVLGNFFAGCRLRFRNRSASMTCSSSRANGDAWKKSPAPSSWSGSGMSGA